MVHLGEGEIFGPTGNRKTVECGEGRRMLILLQSSSIVFVMMRRRVQWEAHKCRSWNELNKRGVGKYLWIYPAVLNGQI